MEFLENLQWRHIMVVVSDIAGNSIVYSTVFRTDVREDEIDSHYYSFMRGFQKWPHKMIRATEDQLWGKRFHTTVSSYTCNQYPRYSYWRQSIKSDMIQAANKINRTTYSFHHSTASVQLACIGFGGRASKPFVSQCCSCQDWCIVPSFYKDHCCDVIMGAMAS